MRSHGVEHLLGGARTDAGQQLHQAETGHAVARILHEAQHRQHVLDVGAVEEFEAAEFDERNVPAHQFNLQRALWLGCTEQHRLVLQRAAGFAILKDALQTM
jgi:hypothetical protein